jgi:ornithine cyclodeaminase/alanine dehydrogenase-like protein (mu-crystallin family)
MLILSADEIRKVLPMRDAIEAMKQAYTSLSDGQAEVPLRSRLPISPHDGLTLFMPAFVNNKKSQALAVKVVSVFPHNPQLNLPLIFATVLVLEANTGKPVALLEGSSLTAIRTGAASGLATDLLSRSDSHVAAIFGAGAQGRTQLEATCIVRKIEKVWVYDSNHERAVTFVSELAGLGDIPRDIRIAKSSEEAIRQADIICTATTSMTPVFENEKLKPGAHISAIGSYTPEMQEIPTETVRRARIVVDSLSATLAETGDLVIPIRSGLIKTEDINTELGEILLGRKPGRKSADEITLFKSVGIAVQDAMAAQIALENAQKLGLGQTIEW